MEFLPGIGPIETLIVGIVAILLLIVFVYFRNVSNEPFGGFQ